jgi:phosphohistidine phosphatase
MKNMQLFIMRHGQASENFKQDSQRQLLEEGSAEVSTIATWLSYSGVTFDHILVSPFVRAQQTANIINAENSPNCSLATIDLITPSGRAEQVHDYIAALLQSSSIENLLIVSHMPLVSYLTAELTYDKACPIFQTAGVAQIDYDEQNMCGNMVNFVAPCDVVT